MTSAVGALTARETFEAAVAQIAPSETRRHAWILYGLIRWLQPQAVVEVGSWMGYCTAWMARALQENGAGRLYAMDKFERTDTSPALLQTHLRAVGVEPVVTLIHGDSAEVAWPSRVDLAFIDGNHTRATCDADVYHAAAAGASCIVIHDTSLWWGPRDYVDAFRKAGHHEWDLLEVIFDSGLAILMRRQEKPAVKFSAQTHPLGYGHG